MWVAITTCLLSRCRRAQAAWLQVGQVHDAQVQLLHWSWHEPHWQLAWLHVGQAQVAQSHLAQESAQFSQLQLVHSS
jgi:hypothetical protein